MTLIDPRYDASWDEELSQHSGATVFHSSAWAHVLCETYGHVPLYFRLSRNGKPAALVPLMEVRSLLTGHRGVGLPFSDFCAPLLLEQDASDAVTDRLEALAKERNWKFLELRGPLPGSRISTSWKSVYVHSVDLRKSDDEIFGQFTSSARGAVRKAERDELTIEITSELQAIREFYGLHSRTRRRHGIPPQPYRFFRNIHEHIIQRGHGYLVVARRDSRPIAVSVFFHWGQNAIHKFGASDERHQEHRGNNLVMLEGIKHAAHLGLSTLHLGRTDLTHTGLRRFKLSLGAREEVLHYFRFDSDSSSWIASSPGHQSSLPGAVFRRLPLTVNRLAGTLLYPHLH